MFLVSFKSALNFSKMLLRASLRSLRIFLNSLTSVLETSSEISAETSVAISDLTFADSEASLLADAVAKKARVESVRMVMNFDFMRVPSYVLLIT